jgi:hypothetical protein
MGDWVDDASFGFEKRCPECGQEFRSMDEAVVQVTFNMHMRRNHQ